MHFSQILAANFCESIRRDKIAWRNSFCASFEVMVIVLAASRSRGSRKQGASRSNASRRVRAKCLPTITRGHSGLVKEHNEWSTGLSQSTRFDTH